MNTLCYVRQGRKFVPVPNYIGYFYGPDGFQKEKTCLSYAIVVSQDVNIAILTSLKRSTKGMTWDVAKAFCDSMKNSYMPSLIEMLQAAKFKEHLQFEMRDTEWLSTESPSNNAWYIHWGSTEDVCDCSKNYKSYARPFFKMNVLTEERVK